VKFLARERSTEAQAITQAPARLCYEGEAFRRVLLAGGTPEQRARAALGLTEPDCLDPALGPTQRDAALDEEQALLDGVDPSSLSAPLAFLANRLRLRRGAVLAQLAWSRTRKDDAAGAAKASADAVRELALVTKGDLLDEDLRLLDETGLRVATARWAAEPAAATTARKGALGLKLHATGTGETCLEIEDPRRETGKKTPPFTRCTWGHPWLASVRTDPTGAALAVSVQTLPGWIELWLFQRAPDAEGGFTVAVLTAAPTDPDLGYVEAAGFSPDGKHLLVVREVLQTTPARAVKREFQELATATLAVEHRAFRPDMLVPFRRWASPDWKGRTLALR
jgi:hypothetical protein